MKKIIRLTESELTRVIKRIVTETLKYDPKKVVHMDDEHIVIDKDLKWDGKYKKKDVSYEDDDWMVIDLEELEDELKEQPKDTLTRGSNPTFTPKSEPKKPSYLTDKDRSNLTTEKYKELEKLKDPKTIAEVFLRALGINKRGMGDISKNKHEAVVTLVFSLFKNNEDLYIRVSNELEKYKRDGETLYEFIKRMIGDTTVSHYNEKTGSIDDTFNTISKKPVTESMYINDDGELVDD